MNETQWEVVMRKVGTGLMFGAVCSLVMVVAALVGFNIYSTLRGGEGVRLRTGEVSELDGLARGL